MKEICAQAVRHTAISRSRKSPLRAKYVLMELLPPRYHRLDHRDTDAAADVAQEIYRTGNLACDPQKYSFLA